MPTAPQSADAELCGCGVRISDLLLKTLTVSWRASRRTASAFACCPPRSSSRRRAGPETRSWRLRCICITPSPREQTTLGWALRLGLGRTGAAARGVARSTAGRATKRATEAATGGMATAAAVAPMRRGRMARTWARRARVRCRENSRRAWRTAATRSRTTTEARAGPSPRAGGTPRTTPARSGPQAAATTIGKNGAVMTIGATPTRRTARSRGASRPGGSSSAARRSGGRRPSR
mmetsp:Transcript_90808/g.293156  ORF Transcript_90808/g.293156 Transcript_90808/m.293156 type:complete len:235 (-) Transcript_90808:1060-1764(-)